MLICPSDPCFYSPLSITKLSKILTKSLNAPKSFISLLSVSLLLIGVTAHLSAAQGLATVNGKPINSQHYRAHYLQLLESHPNVKGNMRLEKRLAQRAMTPLVIEILLQEEADKTKLDLTQLKVIDPIIALTERYKTDQRLNDYLRRIGETKESLRRRSWRAAVTRSLMERQGLLKVTDEEVQAEYQRRIPKLHQPDKIEASQILLKLSSKATTNQIEVQRLRAQEIYEQIKQKKISFEVAVWKHSDGPRKFKEGSLGLVKRGELVQSVEETIWSLKQGELSPPVRSRYGWHIIRRGILIKGKTYTLEDVRSSIIEMLVNKRHSREKRKFIKELWVQAKIESSLPLRP